MDKERYSIIFSSLTGNTKKLADTIRAVLPAEDCDYFGAPKAEELHSEILYIGFWTDKGNADSATLELLSKLRDKKVFLFGTAGFGGLAITSTKAKNGISAVSTLERIYDKYGQAVLDTTLRLAIATWEGENNSLSGSILMGIARIVMAYGDSLKEDVFKDHVGRVSVKAIIRAAKERRPGALGYSEAMIIEYNKKSKFRLSLKTLYGGKQTSDEDEFGEE